jgi:hypothetical protein
VSTEDQMNPSDAEPELDIESGAATATGIEPTTGPAIDAPDQPDEVQSAPASDVPAGADSWADLGTESEPSMAADPHSRSEMTPGPTPIVEPGGPDVAGEPPSPADEEGWSTPTRHTRGALEQWSVLALVAALIGVLPFTWPVPVLSLMAVGFALVGVRNCQLDPTWRNRWMAVLAGALGLATLCVVIVLTGLNRLKFLPFWTTT